MKVFRPRAFIRLYAELYHDLAFITTALKTYHEFRVKRANFIILTLENSLRIEQPRVPTLAEYKSGFWKTWSDQLSEEEVNEMANDYYNRIKDSTLSREFADLEEELSSALTEYRKEAMAAAQSYKETMISEQMQFKKLERTVGGFSPTNLVREMYKSNFNSQLQSDFIALVGKITTILEKEAHKRHKELRGIKKEINKDLMNILEGFLYQPDELAKFVEFQTSFLKKVEAKYKDRFF